jgi:hypothetical protein
MFNRQIWYYSEILKLYFLYFFLYNYELSAIKSQYNSRELLFIKKKETNRQTHDLQNDF